MALIHEWAAESATAQIANVTMAARRGILDDIEKAAALWFLANRDHVLVSRKVLLWTIKITIGDCIGLLKLIFGDDFATKINVPKPGPIAA